MNAKTTILKLRTRLNKIHSSDYDNIPDWVGVEAINKSALEISRIGIKGIGNTEGSEQTSMRVTDFQQLLTSYSITPKNLNPLFAEGKLPSNFLWYNKILVYGQKDCCTNQLINSEFVEEASTPEFIKDPFLNPDFEWRETFHTVINNNIRVYRKDFEIDKIDMVYYRTPIKMDIYGYTHEDGVDSKDVDLEFKDDLSEIIIDNAAAIIAGDIESPNAYKINLERSKNII